MERKMGVDDEWAGVSVGFFLSFFLSFFRVICYDTLPLRIHFFWLWNDLCARWFPSCPP